MSFSEDVGIPMPPDGHYWKERAERAEAAHMASFSALQRISELTSLEGEVDDYEDVVKAVSMLAEGRIGTLMKADPKPAPSNARGIVQITKEQLEALNFATKNLGRAFDIIPDDFKKHQLNAEKAVEEMKICFGASSRDYITLYPTIG